MKWGIRRYQNPDGTLTAAGKRRYADDVSIPKSNSSGKQGRVQRSNIEKREQWEKPK